ncbi:GNAT family N-acetyltransferase [Oleisolibacter albus]|uniref:GNAT family N-acetyltransferase n=1 Tax=Oleisolibacter albus TaxID=2171757 RepID=UPI000DF1F223|nr:GNAT family N-acetyltransferase [Oleisolibacter albus]
MHPWDGLRVEPLAPRHDRTQFRCGVDALDRYFRLQAGQDARKHLAAPFVLIDDADRICGFYTLSAFSVSPSDLPQALIRRLPRYPLIPATLLGRLAIDGQCRGRGLGRFLLADALHRVLRSEIASFAIIVDAKDAAAAAFYRREGFHPFADHPDRLFLPMDSIRALFA